MKALLFDLEGTLVESAYQQSPELIVELRITTRDKLVELGVPEETLSGLVRSSAIRNRAFQWADDNLSPDFFEPRSRRPCCLGTWPQPVGRCYTQTPRVP